MANFLTDKLQSYKYNGARSLVLLHEQHLKSFWATWREAKLLNISLPKTNDPDYESLETILIHVLRSAGNYMIWICEKLELPNPNIITVPNNKIIEKEAENYFDYLLEKWSLPLSEVEEEKFYSPPFTSNWGVDYCIEAMLEHAVMHPIRHEFQLKQLILQTK